jgi:hypothetical protein
VFQESLRTVDEQVDRVSLLDAELLEGAPHGQDLRSDAEAGSDPNRRGIRWARRTGWTCRTRRTCWTRRTYWTSWTLTLMSCLV